MGNVSSSEGTAASPRILLLGSSGSGKSTLFRQVKAIQGQLQPTAEDTQRLHALILEGIYTLVQQSAFLAEQGQKTTHKAEDAASYVLSQAVGATTVTPTMVEHIEALLHEDGIKETYRLRHKFYLDDAAWDFLHRAKEHTAPDATLSVADTVRLTSHGSDTNVDEAEIALEDGQHAILLDNGGRRGQRSVLSPRFLHTHAVVFVAALDEYASVCYEDLKTDRLKESLSVLRQVLDCGYFAATPITILLTKQDQLQDKLDRVPLAQHRPKYTGSSAKDATAFLKETFMALNRAKRTDIRIHALSSLDQEEVKGVMDAVAQQLNKESLAAVEPY